MKKKKKRCSSTNSDSSKSESDSKTDSTTDSRSGRGAQRSPKSQAGVLTDPVVKNPPGAVTDPLVGDATAAPEPVVNDHETALGGVANLETKREHQIQRALEGTDTTRDEVPETVLDVLGDGGKQLNQPLQRTFEERMDADFSSVRIHTGTKAAEAAEAIDAKAFTCGNDIVFNSGEFDPESPDGQHLLAHELAHVKQQTGAAVSMMPQEGNNLEVDPDPQLEREADKEAQRVMKGAEIGLESIASIDVHIQRTPKANKSLNELAELFDIRDYIDGNADIVDGDGTINSEVGRTVTENMRKQIDGLPERDNTDPPHSVKQNVSFAILRLNESTLTVAVASGKRRSNEDEEKNPLLPGPYKDERHYDHRSDENNMDPAAMWCTEPKLLEHVAQEYDPETTEGEVLLFTERPPCDAGCDELVDLFESDYTGVDVKVSHDPDMRSN
ncbi:eCIS core domain-containing protein [Halobiforma nitratireducens]|uniref:eCIS core domain-containing protein n=1 Tax=Halobiforma nitratireducens TaxID=130048 RepID=UPI0009FFBF8E|nr:DUF4157 domain-containing protein [Halobiforma nitratireducens]